MIGVVIAFGILTSSAQAQDTDIDARAPRTGALELVYGTNLEIHLLGAQYYASDQLKFRLQTMLSSYPTQEVVDWVTEFSSESASPLEANEYRTIDLNPSVSYSFAQLGTDSSAVVLQGGGGVMASLNPNASEFVEAFESHQAEVTGNSTALYVLPTVGAAYIKNLTDGSLEVGLDLSLFLPVWGNSGFGVSEIADETFEGREMMSMGVSSLLEVGYRWKSLLVLAGVNFSRDALSKEQKAWCDELDSGCESSNTIVPVFALGASFGGGGSGDDTEAE